ncbi:MAG: hypothetical protein QOH47_619 [Sphingomonadales bacterium]|jgi:hypothetical protein|nr:hypothetical protein [Sphingomonadales bacterium]
MRACPLLLVLLALAGGPARAQTVVTSPGPDHVAVTLYREPNRPPERQPDLGWLNGYALISETRRVTLPAGESELRFEGVAGGMVPQSAIVTGFPEGMIERNRDAYLLSPATLLDRSLGRRVTIRRTSAATGAVTETEAVIRTGAEGAVVLQTSAGFEALRCTGLPETLVYGEVPAGLSARPTLSVRVRARQPITATVTLSYLASGFDWQANYIATLAPDGGHVELFAWLTLASMDETSFVDADTQAVAGRLNREQVQVQPREGGPLELHCWPQSSTSDIPLQELQRRAARQEYGGDGIAITGSRIPRPNLESAAPITVINAVQEELGDLKLYRIPEPVTVAAHSQKQVALLTRPDVQVRLVYRQRFAVMNGVTFPQEAPWRVLVSRNRTAEGLGLPLPSGRLVLFGGDPARPILLGEGSVDDRAVGEDVEVELGPSPGVTTRFRLLGYPGGRGEFELVVSNDGGQPVTFEGTLYFNQVRADARLGRRDGSPLWVTRVPANGRSVLRFRAELPANARPAIPAAAGDPYPARRR